MDIAKVLTISTAHISEETAELLSIEPETDTMGLSVYCKSEYGWFIHVPDDIRERGESIPKDLWSCMLVAYTHNCKWLCLDCDGHEMKELETYEW